jgi:hypothetical protein
MDEVTLINVIQRLRTLGQEWNTVDAKRELILKESKVDPDVKTESG